MYIDYRSSLASRIAESPTNYSTLCGQVVMRRPIQVVDRCRQKNLITIEGACHLVKSILLPFLCHASRNLSFVQESTSLHRQEEVETIRLDYPVRFLEHCSVRTTTTSCHFRRSFALSALVASLLFGAPCLLADPTHRIFWEVRHVLYIYCVRILDRGQDFIHVPPIQALLVVACCLFSRLGD